MNTFTSTTTTHQMTSDSTGEAVKPPDTTSSSSSSSSTQSSNINTTALQEQNEAAAADAVTAAANGWSSSQPTSSAAPTSVAHTISSNSNEQPAVRSALLSPASQARASQSVDQSSAITISPVKLNGVNESINSTPKPTSSQQLNNNDTASSLTTPATVKQSSVISLPTTSPSMQPIRNSHSRHASQLNNNVNSSIPSFAQLQAQHVHSGEMSEDSSSQSLIVNVWSDNLVREIKAIESIVDKYSYIAMDTEFPGVVARSVGTFKTSADYFYQLLKCNVDILKMIQLGLCFCDADGNLVPGTCTWQFNFSFNIESDMYAENSIDLLKSSGIDFDAHQSRGCDPMQFAELLMTSGIVLNDDITWISFASGYDFGYLLRLLTSTNLPLLEQDFLSTLYMYFPCFYDIKYLLNKCNDLNGGLQAIGNQLGVKRIGQQHQAGSDALLTLSVFWEIRRQYYNDEIEPQNYMNHLHQFGSNCAKPTIAQRYHAKNINNVIHNNNLNSTVKKTGSPSQLSQYPQQSSNDDHHSNDQYNNRSSITNTNNRNASISNSNYNNNNAYNNHNTAASSAAASSSAAALAARYTTPDARGTKKKTSTLISSTLTSATPPVFSDFNQ